MKKKISVLILLVSAFFMLNTCEFDVYRWAGVPYPIKDKNTGLLPNEPTIFFNEGPMVRRSFLPDAMNPTPQLGGDETFERQEIESGQDMIVNKQTNSIYWSKQNRIYRMKANWQDMDIIVEYVDPIAGFTIDNRHNQVIFSSTGTNRIMRADLAPNAQETELIQEAFIPGTATEFVFDPDYGSEGTMFFIIGMSVWTVPMSTLVPSSITSAADPIKELAIDPFGNFLYYYIPNTGEIRAYDYPNASDTWVTTLAALPVLDLAVDYHFGFIYFSADMAQDQIYRVSTGGAGLFATRQEPRSITTIATYIP